MFGEQAATIPQRNLAARPRSWSWRGRSRRLEPLLAYSRSSRVGGSGRSLSTCRRPLKRWSAVRLEPGALASRRRRIGPSTASALRLAGCEVVAHWLSCLRGANLHRWARVSEPYTAQACEMNAPTSACSGRPVTRERSESAAKARAERTGAVQTHRGPMSNQAHARCRASYVRECWRRARRGRTARLC